MANWQRKFQQRERRQTIKTGIRVTVYALLAMILFLCEHKEPCSHHSHMVTLGVDPDWENAPQADPEGTCVYFYLEGGKSPIRFDFMEKGGGSVEIKGGRYWILCYNDDTESLLSRGMEGFDTHGGYTWDDNVFESIYGSGAHYAPPAEGSEDECAVICPDMMWGGCVRNVEITELGLSHEYISFADKDKAERTESNEHITTLYPAESICTYAYEVRNVKNMEYMTQACGPLSSMAPPTLLANEELDRECVIVPFETELHLESSKMTGRFYMLGHHEENACPHKMTFYVWYSNKEKLYTTFDVADQVYKALDRKHVHIIIDSAGFPGPFPNEDGFDVEIDDWVEVENDIIMQSSYF